MMYLKLLNIGKNGTVYMENFKCPFEKSEAEQGDLWVAKHFRSCGTEHGFCLSDNEEGLEGSKWAG